MKKHYTKHIKNGQKIESSFIINKIISKKDGDTVALIGDKTGDIKAYFKDKNNICKVGNIIVFKGTFSENFKCEVVKKIDSFDLYEYLPSVERPIEEIMNELESITKNEFKSKEAIELNNYFFKNPEFLSKFKKGIGGIYQHHNYIGGLAEHTLNVTYLAKILSYRYDCRYKEIAILSAKLHDIGKIKELFFEGPFKYTLQGDMEGHIVIGINMLEEAFKANPTIYSEDFKTRIKACVVQHHGKIEFGSPRDMKTEEAFIVHYSDYLDATLNKISIIKKNVPLGTWSDYDRRIEGKLYL
ncbi:HD domain-containing protein [Clostridium tarantellae]|uniref:HD domain-containing protein n=1 Tax=Clostridium tarantellae TaxID=39493 RepID=A0A6I1MHW0_9CLOT|nr:HD domain-containing protein [Clostridium tarantellae]MPQ42995.1 HD domain-containing protein [Clostridium tarantellae]